MADPVDYLVEAGDSICSIAARNGHVPSTLWDDPANAELKNARKDPELLVPGDRMSIAAVRPKNVACATGELHVFRITGRKTTVTIYVEDEEGAPFADKRYELVAGDATISGTTDDSGKLEATIDARARDGTLRVWLEEPGLPDPYEREVRFGELPPADHPDGLQRRLANLSLWFGSSEDLSPAALSAFQTAQGIEATGAADDATLQKLVEIHRV